MSKKPRKTKKNQDKTRRNDKKTIISCWAGGLQQDGSLRCGTGHVMGCAMAPSNHHEPGKWIRFAESQLGFIGALKGEIIYAILCFLGSFKNICGIFWVLIIPKWHDSLWIPIVF